MKRLLSSALAAVIASAAFAPAAAIADDDRRGGRYERDDHRGHGKNRREHRRDERREDRAYRQGYREGYRDERYDDRWRGYERWRDDGDWRSWEGRRTGYYYAPRYGYYRVPPGHVKQWRRGERLPQDYWRYRIYEPYDYGLRSAPRGYAWVHMDDDALLISLATGLIADVIFDIY